MFMWLLRHLVSGHPVYIFLTFQDEGADLPFSPPLRNELYLVPSGVRPVMQRTAIEVRLTLRA